MNMLLDPNLASCSGGGGGGNVTGGQNQPNNSPKTTARKQRNPNRRCNNSSNNRKAVPQSATLGALGTGRRRKLLIVDTDSIGHEILLPPAVPAGERTDRHVVAPSPATATGANSYWWLLITTKPKSILPSQRRLFRYSLGLGDPDVGNKNISTTTVD
jgi:hypothetical protein